MMTMMKADDLPPALNAPSLDKLRGAHCEKRAITQRCATQREPYVRASAVGKR